MKRKRKTRDENIFDTLSNSIWFKESCSKIRELYVKRGYDEVYLKSAVKPLTQHLPAYWEETITNFIKTMKLNQPSLKGAHIVFNEDFVAGRQELFIRVYRDTTQEDVLKLWKTVKQFQAKLREIWTPELSDIELLMLSEWERFGGQSEKKINIAKEVAILLRTKHGLDYSEADIRKRISDIRKQLHAYKKPRQKQPPITNSKK